MNVLISIHYRADLVTLHHKFVFFFTDPLVYNFQFQNIHPTWDIDTSNGNITDGYWYERMQVVTDGVDLHAERFVLVDAHVEFFKDVREGIG